MPLSYTPLHWMSKKDRLLKGRLPITKLCTGPSTTESTIRPAISRNVWLERETDEEDLDVVKEEDEEVGRLELVLKGEEVVC